MERRFVTADLTNRSGNCRTANMRDTDDVDAKARSLSQITSATRVARRIGLPEHDVNPICRAAAPFDRVAIWIYQRARGSRSTSFSIGTNGVTRSGGFRTAH